MGYSRFLVLLGCIGLGAVAGSHLNFLLTQTSASMIHTLLSSTLQVAVLLGSAICFFTAGAYVERAIHLSKVIERRERKHTDLRVQKALAYLGREAV